MQSNVPTNFKSLAKQFPLALNSKSTSSSMQNKVGSRARWAIEPTNKPWEEAHQAWTCSAGQH